ncbi:MAG TPA: ureidoglycolate lyase [Dongiaceae bacterium]
MEVEPLNLKPEGMVMPDFPIIDLPLIEGTAASLAGYGEIVDNPETHRIEIVRWPALGWRQVDTNSGDEGGTTEGIFACQWVGDVLKAQNHAVGGDYVLGWSCLPSLASESNSTMRRYRALMWRANYHPDGGQMFFPLDKGPFVVPMALPGDDVKPQDFKAFWFDGSKGLYMHPNVWHDGVFPVGDQGRYFGKQGKVHARISANFPKEFGCYLGAPLLRD